MSPCLNRVGDFNREFPCSKNFNGNKIRYHFVNRIYNHEIKTSINEIVHCIELQRELNQPYDTVTGRPNQLQELYPKVEFEFENNFTSFYCNFSQYNNFLIELNLCDLIYFC